MFILEMLKFNILAAAIILITLLVSRILKNKYSVRWRYWTWLVVAVLLLLPFQFTALRPVIRINVPQETGVQTAGVSEAELITDPEAESTAYVSEAMPGNAVVPDIEEHPGAAETMTSEEIPVPAEPMMPAETRDIADHPVVNRQASAVSLPELEKWILYVWIAGIAVVFVIRMLQYIAVKRKLGKYRHRVDTQEVLSTYVRLCRKLGIQKPPVLYLQPALQSPLMTGLIRPALYLPGEAYTAVELELIFLHELHHYQHKDLWYKFFLSLSGMIYWFNPAIWLMRREANRDLEALCDSAVIRSAADSQKSRAYGQLLLQTSMERSFLQQAALGLNDSVTDFKERINYMISARKRKNGIAVCLILACSLMLANQLVGCASVAAESGSGQAEASSVESSTTSETSASAAETASISQEAASTSEISPASLTPAPTVYETENFTFTLPEIWQGQVTGRIEEETGATLILEWKGIQLGWIEVESVSQHTSGDIGLANVWHSEQEYGYYVSLWVQNYAYILPHAEMDPSLFPEYLSELSDEEKEQLLFLTTGGEVTYAEATDYCQTHDTEDKTLTKTAAFYRDNIAPGIIVKDLASLVVKVPTVYETEYFTFTLPEIWQGQVTGRVEGGAVAEKLVLEWNGNQLATIRVESTINTQNTGDNLFNRAWHSEEENGYHVALWVDNYSHEIYTSKLANVLTEEEKEQLLYLSSGGSITLEETNEIHKTQIGWDQTKEKTVDFYNEAIVPYIEVKNLSSIQPEAMTTYETENFSFTIPEFWQGQVTGRIKENALTESLILEWNGISLASIGVERKESHVSGDIGNSNIWHSEEENGYWVCLWVENFAFTIPLASSFDYSDEYLKKLSSLTDEEKEQILYLTTGGRVSLAEAINAVQHTETEGQTIRNTSEFYKEYIVPYIEIKNMP